jgi:hypothetical protein
MNEHHEINEQREIDQFSLSTFPFDAHNRFDSVADQAIRQLQQENEMTGQEYNDWQVMKDNVPARWKELEEQAAHRDVSLDGLVDGMMLDVVYREMEMVALMEMKIIYAWKHLEIHIKKLIGAAYPGVDTNDFYRWKSVVTFLKSKDIRPEELDGYHEIVQLQQVNNRAKHTDLPYAKLQSVPEFANQTTLNFEDFEKFYARVKGAPDKFLKALTGVVFRELYHFDDQRIEDVARSLALRMDPEVARKFREVFESMYLPVTENDSPK